MKNNFDENIKNSLKNLKNEPKAPMDWSELERKLDLEEELDSLIKESMDVHRESYNQDHWNILEKEIKRRRKNLYIKRISEVAIIILLLFTSKNIIQYKSVNSNRPLTVFNQLNGIIKPLPTLENNSVVLKIDVNESNYPQLDEFHKGKTSNEDVENSDIMILASLPVSLIPSRVLEIGRPSVTREPSSRKSAVRYLETSGVQQLEVENVGFADFDMLVDNGTENSDVWIGANVQAGVNFINSSLDLSKFDNEIMKRSGSISYGITFMKEMKNFSLITGLNKTQKRYYPEEITALIRPTNQNLVERKLNSASFSEIQIPLILRYNSPRFFGIGVFGSVGLGLNFITNAEYELFIPTRQTISSQNHSLLAKEKLNNLPKGLFESGSISDNVYGHMHFGFGLETRFNKRYTLIFETVYQQSLPGQINPLLKKTQLVGLNTSFLINLNQ